MTSKVIFKIKLSYVKWTVKFNKTGFRIVATVIFNIPDKISKTWFSVELNFHKNLTKFFVEINMDKFLLIRRNIFFFMSHQHLGY